MGTAESCGLHDKTSGERYAPILACIMHFANSRLEPEGMGLAKIWTVVVERRGCTDIEDGMLCESLTIAGMGDLG